MSATTGYFVAGSSWLHRRNPLTKLLALGLILLAAFLLPPIVLPVLAVVIVVAAWSAGLLRPMARAMRIPALLLLSIVVVNSLFFPGATDMLVTLGPLSITREGLTFGLDLGRARPGRVPRLGRVPVHDARRRHARVAHRPRGEPPDRVRRPVGRPDGARGCRRGRARSSRRSRRAACRSKARSCAASGRSCRLIGPVVLGSLVDVRERTFALEARGFGARPGRTAYRVVADPPIDRWLRLLIVLAAIGGACCCALGVMPRVTTRRRQPADDRAPLGSTGLGGPLPGPSRTEPRRASSSTVAAGERVGVAGRTGAGKSTLALAAAGFIPRVVRAKLDGRVAIDGVDAATAAARRAARPGRDRVRDAGQPAVGLEADGSRGARVRAREPGRAPGRDGRADRRHAGPPVDRPPRRSRAVRPVGWGAAARGDRQHRGDGHVRPGPRRADRAARSGGHGGRSPTCSAELARAGTAILCVEHDPSVLGRMDRCLVLDARPPGRLGRARRGPGRGGVRSPACRADPRPPGAGGGHRPRGGPSTRPRSRRASRATRRADGRAIRRHGRDGRDRPPHRRPPRRPRTRRPPGRRRAAGHRSASRSRTSSTATRPGSRRSAASRSRSSRARRSRSSARTARARRPS